MSINLVPFLAEVSAPARSAALIIPALFACYIITRKSISVPVRMIIGIPFMAPIVYAVVRAMD